MHLLVLSAFRLKTDGFFEIKLKSQCTFWCSVLSDLQLNGHSLLLLPVSMHLLVLSAFRRDRQRTRWNGVREVSMHLLVLSAFRLNRIHLISDKAFFFRLNAPFGAQCFPT